MNRGTEVESTRELLVFLEKSAKKNDAPIWIAVAGKLSMSKRRKVEVNLGKIGKVVKSGTVIIPGKLLSNGKLEAKVTIAAFSASAAAKEKVAKAGGKLISIKELVAQNPKGSGVVILQ